METPPRNVLAQVRALMPDRPLTATEARQVIDRQAARLLKLTGIEGPPVPTELIVELLPRVQLKRAPSLPDSGRVRWSGSQWIILVASDEAPVRQRFSIGHELAHIVFHPSAAVAFPATSSQTAAQRLETACDRFAASLLMPRPWMKRAFAEAGLQDMPGLSRLFGVSWPACHIRLVELGLASNPHYERAAA